MYKKLLLNCPNFWGGYISIFTLAAIGGAIAFGMQDKTTHEYQGFHLVHETGWIGGSVAMGLVATISLISVVLIELTRFKKNSTLD